MAILEQWRWALRLQKICRFWTKILFLAFLFSRLLASFWDLKDYSSCLISTIYHGGSQLPVCVPVRIDASGGRRFPHIPARTCPHYAQRDVVCDARDRSDDDLAAGPVPSGGDWGGSAARTA